MGSSQMPYKKGDKLVRQDVNRLLQSGAFYTNTGRIGLGVNAVLIPTTNEQSIANLQNSPDLAGEDISAHSVLYHEPSSDGIGVWYKKREKKKLHAYYTKANAHKASKRLKRDESGNIETDGNNKPVYEDCEVYRVVAVMPMIAGQKYVLKAEGTRSDPLLNGQPCYWDGEKLRRIVASDTEHATEFVVCRYEYNDNANGEIGNSVLNYVDGQQFLTFDEAVYCGDTYPTIPNGWLELPGYVMYEDGIVAFADAQYTESDIYQPVRCAIKPDGTAVWFEKYRYVTDDTGSYYIYEGPFMGPGYAPSDYSRLATNLTPDGVVEALYDNVMHTLYATSTPVKWVGNVTQGYAEAIYYEPNEVDDEEEEEEDYDVEGKAVIVHPINSIIGAGNHTDVNMKPIPRVNGCTDRKNPHHLTEEALVQGGMSEDDADAYGWSGSDEDPAYPSNATERGCNVVFDTIPDEQKQVESGEYDLDTLAQFCHDSEVAASWLATRCMGTISPLADSGTSSYVPAVYAAGDKIPLPPLYFMVYFEGTIDTHVDDSDPNNPENGTDEETGNPTTTITTGYDLRVECEGKIREEALKQFQEYCPSLTADDITLNTCFDDCKETVEDSSKTSRKYRFIFYQATASMYPTYQPLYMYGCPFTNEVPFYMRAVNVANNGADCQCCAKVQGLFDSMLIPETTAVDSDAEHSTCGWWAGEYDEVDSEPEKFDIPFASFPFVPSNVYEVSVERKEEKTVREKEEEATDEQNTSEKSTIIEVKVSYEVSFKDSKYRPNLIIEKFTASESNTDLTATLSFKTVAVDKTLVTSTDEEGNTVTSEETAYVPVSLDVKLIHVCDYLGSYGDWKVSVDNEAKLVSYEFTPKTFVYNQFASYPFSVPITQQFRMSITSKTSRAQRAYIPAISYDLDANEVLIPGMEVEYTISKVNLKQFYKVATSDTDDSTSQSESEDETTSTEDTTSTETESTEGTGLTYVDPFYDSKSIEASKAELEKQLELYKAVSTTLSTISTQTTEEDDEEEEKDTSEWQYATIPFTYAKVKAPTVYSTDLEGTPDVKLVQLAIDSPTSAEIDDNIISKEDMWINLDSDKSKYLDEFPTCKTLNAIYFPAIELDSNFAPSIREPYGAFNDCDNVGNIAAFERSSSFGVSYFCSVRLDYIPYGYAVSTKVPSCYYKATDGSNCSPRLQSTIYDVTRNDSDSKLYIKGACYVPSASLTQL